MKRSLSLEAVFFDLDGTLVDVRRRFHLAYDEARAAYGLSPLVYEEFAERYRRGDLSSDLPMEERARFWGIFLNLFSEYDGPHLGRPMPGSVELLEEIKSGGRATSVITNRITPCFTVMEELEKLGLGAYIDAVFSHISLGAAISEKRFERRHFNKAPLLRKALECLGVDPARTAYVGDLASDIDSAREAGLRYAFGVLSGGGGRSELEKAEPDAILDSVAGLADYL